jgi:hypothetical protein
MNDVDSKFIQQVFYGCIRYQKMLQLFVNSFLYKNPAMAQRSDKTLYMIIGYLAFFRLTELGFDTFRNFVMCEGLGTPPAKNALLHYIFSEEDLNDWVKQEWCKVYDMRYIEEDVIGLLQKMKPQAVPLLEEISLLATGTKSSVGGEATAEAAAAEAATKRKTTVPKPFNITQPKPRLIPQPDPISREIKAQPVPEIIHQTSLAKVLAEKTKRLDEEKGKVRSKYKPDDEFTLETAARPGVNEKEALEKAVNEVRYKECTFQPTPSAPYRPPVASAEVRQNVASILREDALVKQKQEKEYTLLKDYERDLRDAS